MYLSKSQWAAMRQLAAEAARRVIGTSNKFNEEFQKALDLGFDPFQLNEYCRIVECTARKQAKQNVNQKSLGLELIIEESRSNVRDMQVANDELRAKLESAVAQNVALAENCRKLSAELSSVHNLNRAMGETARSRVRTIESMEKQVTNLQRNLRDIRPLLGVEVAENHRPQDGDQAIKNDELFTFFMGEWRRPSELEAFSSAKKYL